MHYIAGAVIAPPTRPFGQEYAAEGARTFIKDVEALVDDGDLQPR